MKQKKKGSLFPVILIFLAGLSLLLYPTVSNYWNSLHQTKVIAAYNQQMQSFSQEDYDRMWESARRYNELLKNRTSDFYTSEQLLEEYKKQLNISGIMAYIEIPSINCRLPIYHGTEESVLQVAVGHLEWSSLPVGGESTHCVVSGHRGLPSAELLTHVDRMQIGDSFYVYVLDKVLEYRVDDIAVVEPEDSSRLQVIEGQDHMTLATCTPYGINSHRLLIRGTRVSGGIARSATGQLLLSDEIRPVSMVYVIPLVLLPVITGISIWLWIRNNRKSKRKVENDHEKPSDKTQ